MFYIQRIRSIRKYLWNNARISKWGAVKDFFERTEFQNRGAAHFHTVLWCEATIEQMIASNQIRGDMPNPINEPELHATKFIAVGNHHWCGVRPPEGEQCKQHFPQPLSYSTYLDEISMRYVYKAITKEDRWIVPYHAPALQHYLHGMLIRMLSMLQKKGLPVI